MIYLLDTSAILAHFLKEPGHWQVQELFEDHTASILLATISLLELDSVLRSGIHDDGRRRDMVDLYGGRLAEVVPVDRMAVMKAISLRNASTRRIPAMDALVAGCASACSATLVHRDPHFDAIPSERLAVLRLTDGPEPAPAQEAPPSVKEHRGSYVTRKRTRHHTTARKQTK